MTHKKLRLNLTYTVYAYIVLTCFVLWRTAWMLFFVILSNDVLLGHGSFSDLALGKTAITDLRTLYLMLLMASTFSLYLEIGKSGIAERAYRTDPKFWAKIRKVDAA
ncbi:hypothetical protein [Pararhizobium sp.]|uniref:hypothetical protein n=1 Tax=Pararhizobium sp. TaxID=1977563 RepID=UPI003D0E61EC